MGETGHGVTPGERGWRPETRAGGKKFFATVRKLRQRGPIPASLFIESGIASCLTGPDRRRWVRAQIAPVFHPSGMARGFFVFLTSEKYDAAR